MTATREALVLPVLFLTVALCGSVHLGQTLVLLPMSLYSLILGILLVRLLIQSRALVPGALLSPARGALANINGGVVMLTLWAASAQVFAVLIPDNGLPRLIVSVFFLILLLNTAAASPDRPRLLRSLAVTFGSAFLLKFVVLSALSETGTGWLKRVLLAMVEGVTLGTLTQDVMHPASGYIALFALGLFLIGVFLLPFRVPPESTALQTAGPPKGGRHDSVEFVRGVRL
jgi:hypothetical protein